MSEVIARDTVGSLIQLGPSVNSWEEHLGWPNYGLIAVAVTVGDIKLVPLTIALLGSITIQILARLRLGLWPDDYFFRLTIRIRGRGIGG